METSRIAIAAPRPQGLFTSPSVRAIASRLTRTPSTAPRWPAGFGTTGADIKMGSTLPPVRALVRLRADASEKELALKRCMGRGSALPTRGVDAFVGLAYNTGTTPVCLNNEQRPSTTCGAYRPETSEGACDAILLGDRGAGPVNKPQDRCSHPDNRTLRAWIDRLRLHAMCLGSRCDECPVDHLWRAAVRRHRGRQGLASPPGGTDMLPACRPLGDAQENARNDATARDNATKFRNAEIIAYEDARREAARRARDAAVAAVVRVARSRLPSSTAVNLPARENPALPPVPAKHPPPESYSAALARISWQQRADGLRDQVIGVCRTHTGVCRAGGPTAGALLPESNGF